MKKKHFSGCSISEGIQRGIKIIYFSFLFFSILICFLLSSSDYARKCSYLPNFILAIFGFLIIIGIYSILQIICVIQNHYNISLKSKLTVFYFFTLLFSAIQIFAIYNYYVKTDWDVATIVNAAMEAADGNSLEPHENIFLSTLITYYLYFAIQL